VRGEGVIATPVLAPGERYEYTSGVPLPTASGFMTGAIRWSAKAANVSKSTWPTFSLDSPDGKRVLN